MVSFMELYSGLVSQLVARNLVRIFMTFNNVKIMLIGESKTAVSAIAASFIGKVNEQIGRGHGGCLGDVL